MLIKLNTDRNLLHIVYFELRSYVPRFEHTPYAVPTPTSLSVYALLYVRQIINKSCFNGFDGKEIVFVAIILLTLSQIAGFWPWNSFETSHFLPLVITSCHIFDTGSQINKTRLEYGIRSACDENKWSQFFITSSTDRFMAFFTDKIAT